MPQPKQFTKLLFLILFLQRCDCRKKRTTPRPPYIARSTPQKVANQPLTLANQSKKSTEHAPSKDTNAYPEYNTKFDPEFHYDPDFDTASNAGVMHEENKAKEHNANARNKSDHRYDNKSDCESGYESDIESDDAKPAPKQQHPSDDAKSNRTSNFKNWIKTMRAKADQRRNIIWDVTGNKLTRVAGNMSNISSNLSTPEDYAVQGLNIYRAAEKICTLYGKDGTVFAKKAKEFSEHYSTYFGKTEDDWIDKTKNINYHAVSELQKRVFNNESLDSINEKLRLAENYVGLNDTHYNVTTVFTIQDHKFELEDKHVFKLTEKQKNDYINRKRKLWYMHLSAFEKIFVDAYADKLLAGNHYTPTQLRNHPGVRNGYQKTVSGYNKNYQMQPLTKYYHSGSLPSPNERKDQEAKEADLEITKDNFNQIQEKEKNISVVSLNYNMNVGWLKQLQEKKIVEDTAKVVGLDRFMNISINPIGTCSNLNEKYNELLNYIVNAFANQYPDLCAFFFTDKINDRSILEKFRTYWGRKLLNNHPQKSIQQQIAEIKNPEDKRFFELLMELEAYITKSSTYNFIKQATSIISGNPNATACAIYIALITSLHEDKTAPSILFSCKSGKDRTGLMSLLVDAYTIFMRCPTLTLDEIISALIYTGHYQFLASINGGMPGRFGLKSVQSDQVNSNCAKELFTKAAKFTHIPVTKQKVENGTIHE